MENNNSNNIINDNLRENDDEDEDEDDDFENSILSEFTIDEDIIRIPFIKKILTGCICNFTYFLHFLPSLIYNSCWIIIFNKIIPIDKEIENQKNLFNCIELYNWGKKLINISKIMLTKEFIFMFISLFFGNRDNDFNFFWMILKFLIGFIYSIPINFNLNKFLNNYKMDFDINDNYENINNKEEDCKILNKNLKKFYNIEIFLFKSIGFIIIFIFIVLCILMIYEYWKGRRYII